MKASAPPARPSRKGSAPEEGCLIVEAGDTVRGIRIHSEHHKRKQILFANRRRRKGGGGSGERQTESQGP